MTQIKNFRAASGKKDLRISRKRPETGQQPGIWQGLPEKLTENLKV